MSLSSILRANYLIPLSLSLRRPRARAIGVQKRETDTGEDRGFFCLFCFLRSLYSNRQRDVIYIKENLCCCWGKTLDFVSQGVRAFCSPSPCISGLSLSLFTCASQKRERECVLASRVSSVLDSLLFSLFFCRCSFPLKSLVSKDQERELAATLGRRTATVKATTTLSFSPFREEFISRWCSIRSGVQN